MRECVCVCVDSVLSRCLIFCQLPAKMPHVSAGGVVCVNVYYVCGCVDSVLSRCHIFCQLPAMATIEDCGSGGLHI